MRLPLNQLAEHLTKGLKPVYTLLGDEALGQRETLDTLRQSARQQGYDERVALSVERGFNWQQLTAIGQSVSLFSSLKLVELHIPSGKPGVDGSQQLQALAETGLPDACLMIILPALDWRDQKSAWYQALEKHTVLIAIDEVPPAQLPAWIAKRLAQQSQTTDADTLAFLAHQVEGNLLAAHQEIQKLGLLYPPGILSSDAVREAVLNVSRFDPAQLSEAVLLGDVERTVRILQGLQDEGVQPITVMNPVLWAIKPLVKVKLAESQGESLQTAFSQARLFGDKQTQAKHAIRRLSLRQLEAALLKLADIDKMAKGLLKGDAWLELSRLCFGLARIKPKRSA